MLSMASMSGLWGVDLAPFLIPLRVALVAHTIGVEGISHIHHETHVLGSDSRGDSKVEWRPRLQTRDASHRPRAAGSAGSSSYLLEP